MNWFRYLKISLHLVVIAALVSSCKDTGGAVEGKVTSGIANNNEYTWNFANSAAYTFDSNYISVSGNRASLKSVNTTYNSASTFDAGTHSATEYSGSVLKIRSLSATSFDASLALPSLTSNMAGYWRFEGNFNDTLGYNNGSGNNGALNNGSAYIGTASAEFDGVNDYVSIPNSTRFDGSTITIAGWVKTDLVWGTDGGSAGAGQGTSTLWARSDTNGRNGFMVGSTALGYLYTETFDTTNTQRSCTSASPAIIANTWHHVAVVIPLTGGQNISMYVDGALVNSCTNGTGFSFNSQDVWMGDSPNNWFEEFHGNIDDVIYWNTGLSAAQVRTLYEAQSQRYQELGSGWTPKWTNITGYWRFDNGWNDSSGNGRTATAFGSAAITATGKIGPRAATFDGNNDYATVPDAAAIKQQQIKTISVWFKKVGDSTDTTYGYLVRKGTSGTSDMIALWVEDGNPTRLYFGVAKPSTVSTPVAASASNAISNDVWHHVAGVVEASAIKLYLDGSLVSTTAITELPNDSADTLWIAGSNGPWAELNGVIDELAIWNTPLTAGEVQEIYHRQKQKYAGTYKSPVINMGASGASWESLASVTSLPFLKELPPKDSTESGYSAVTSLSTGLVANWHLNETAGVSFADSSGNGHTATAQNSPNLATDAVFGNGVALRRASTHYISTPSLNLGSQFTLSIWAKLRPMTVDAHTLFSNSGGGASDGFRLMVNSWGVNNGRVIFETGNGTAFTGAYTPIGIGSHGVWHHIVAAVNKTTGIALIYVDGKLQNPVDQTIRTDFNTSAVLNIGRIQSGSGHMDGLVDEAAVWTRILSASEVLELYRRGANRVKFQARSCIESSCSCKSYSAAPAGSASDCDGDGTANSSDTSDAHKADWLGPDGTSATFFSELHNNTAVSAAGVPTGTVNLGSLTLDWASAFFTANARPSANQYFQYRVFLESDDEGSACSSATCMPEVSAITVGPTGRYFGGKPSIVGNTGKSYITLESLTKLDTGACTTYQISTDNGSTWKWWDGSAWSTASSATQSNYLSDFTTARLGTQGAGTFKFKAFLNTNASFGQSCDLSEVKVTVK